MSVQNNTAPTNRGFEHLYSDLVNENMIDLNAFGLIENRDINDDNLNPVRIYDKIASSTYTERLQPYFILWNGHSDKGSIFSNLPREIMYVVGQSLGIQKPPAFSKAFDGEIKNIGRKKSDVSVPQNIKQNLVKIHKLLKLEDGLHGKDELNVDDVLFMKEELFPQQEWNLIEVESIAGKLEMKVSLYFQRMKAGRINNDFPVRMGFSGIKI